MLFNSLAFLIFFPIVVLTYFIIPHKVRYLWLLASSYFFYMWWNPRYALLMAASTLFTWLGGFVISKAKSQRCKKLAVGLNFIVNLLILFFFKYFTFTIDNINLVITHLGLSPLKPTFDIILPVGISFYTFQALGYTVDVYRGDVKHEKNILKYALFVSFFPQLVAGPIERSKNLLHQLSEKHTFSYNRMVKGLLLMLWGFFLKLVIADRVAILVDTVYNAPQSFFGWQLLVAAFGFAIQLYCDFYSYTCIARGSARVMGFELMENFNCPYFSRSIAEFWRRWHISLSSWFRDYLYIPLGGNRRGKFRKYLNTIIVFTASGLWHGANMTFVVWGLFHGLAIVLGEITKKLRRFFCSLFGIEQNTGYHKLFQTVFTFLLVTFSLIFFRAQSIGSAVLIIRKIFVNFRPDLIVSSGFLHLGLDTPNLLVLFLSILILTFSDIRKYSGKNSIDTVFNMNIIARFFVILLLLFWVLIFGIYGGDYSASQFIYFQF